MIVLVHGFMGGPSSWRRVDVPDARALTLPGHHEEPLVPDFDAAVAWLAAQLDEPSHVVGYSMGARIALATALRHPARVERLTCFGGGVGLEGDLAARVRWEDEIAALMVKDFDRFLERWTALPLFATQRRVKMEVLAEQDRLRRSHDPARLAATFQNLALSSMPNLWVSLGRLQMPATFAAGADDDKYIAIAKRAAACVPQGRFVAVADSGHNVPLEKPKAVKAVIADRGDT